MDVWLPSTLACSPWRPPVLRWPTGQPPRTAPHGVPAAPSALADGAVPHAISSLASAVGPGVAILLVGRRTCRSGPSSRSRRCKAATCSTASDKHGASTAADPQQEEGPPPAPAPDSQVGSAPALSKPSVDFTGGHYIVTGGTQGLGLEIARQLKACGAARIALLSRSKAKGDASCAELTDGRCTAYFVEADMSDPMAVQAGAQSAIEALNGRVDGLVNAAGTTERGNLLDTTVEMFDKQFSINTRAPFLLTQAVAKHLIAQKARGSIVNVSSIAAKGGAPFIMAYSASKAALNVLTANNATELAPYGIRVNSINMGWTCTENESAMMAKKGGPNWLEEADASLPLKRLLRPVDVACTVLFLLSPASMMTTGNCYDLHPDAALGMLSAESQDTGER